MIHPYAPARRCALALFHLAAVVAFVVGLAGLAAPASAQCGGNVTLAVSGAPDQALVGDTCFVRGGEVFVGAPNISQVNIFRRQTGVTPYVSVGALARPSNIGVADAFGRSLAADGEVCAVGAPLWSGGQGTITLYKRTAAGVWSVLQQITPPSAQSSLFFGCSVSMSQGFMIVGAPGALNASQWSPGIAYLYGRQSDGTYMYLRALTPSQPTTAVDGMFGQCVSISNGIIAVGAPGELYSGETRTGTLYVFARQTDGTWPLFARAKSPLTGSNTRNYAVDCFTDNGLIAVREQVLNAGAADVIWCYNVGTTVLNGETSYTAGRSTQYSYAPVADADLVGSISMREGVMAVGSRTTNSVSMYTRGVSQWNLLTSYNSGSLGAIDLGAAVSVGHDTVAIGMPYWELNANNQPGAAWIQPLPAAIVRDCDADGTIDACEAMSQASSAFDDDYDGIPDNCEVAAAPTAAVATTGNLSTGVGVTWRISGGASQYQVQRSVGGGNPTQLVNTWIPEYLDTSASPDVNYTYYIRSIDGAGAVSSAFVQTTGWRAFAAPTNLVASDGSSTTAVNLSWTAVSGAPGYRVFRAIGSGTPVEIGQPTASNFADTTAAVGTVYTYAVKVKGLLGDSEYSNSDTGYIANAATPTGVSATDGTSTANVVVTWNAVANATSYIVYRAVGAGSPAQLATLGNVTTYTDTTATALVSYSYYLRAVVNGSTGPQSVGDTGWRNVAAPASFAATDGSSTLAVNLSWAAVSGSTGYAIWRGSSAANLQQVATVAAGTLTYADPAQAGVVWTYAVQAIHALGTTALSTTDTGWRNLDPPSGLAASDGTYSDKIRLTWNAVPGAVSYRIQRTLPGQSETILANISADNTLYDDTTAPVSATVQYRIRAFSSAGATQASAFETGWRNTPGPANTAASDGTYTDKIRVSWDAVSGATGYKVWRSVNGGTLTALTTVAAGTLSYNDTTAPALTTCSYAVSSLTGAAESATGPADSGWMNRAGPTVTADDGTSTSSVAVRWTAVTGATGYQVYASNAPAAPVLVATLGNTKNWTDVSAAPGVLRSYTVRAIHALGTTPQSAVETGWRSLPVPQSVLASDGTFKDYVQVKWQAVPGATGYQVTRLRPGHAGSQVFGPIATPNWNDKTATPGVRYQYSVAAVSAAGTGVNSPSDLGWRPRGGDSGTGSGGSSAGLEQPPATDQPGMSDGSTEPPVEGGDGQTSSGGGSGSDNSSGSGSGTGNSAGTPGDPSDPTQPDTKGVHWVVDTAVQVKGDINLAAADSLSLRLGAAQDSGSVTTLGTLQLDGTLVLAWQPGFVPSAAAEWTVLRGAQMQGGFRNVALPTPPEGYVLQVIYGKNSVVVRLISASAGLGAAR